MTYMVNAGDAAVNDKSYLLVGMMDGYITGRWSIAEVSSDIFDVRVNGEVVGLNIGRERRKNKNGHSKTRITTS